MIKEILLDMRRTFQVIFSEISLLSLLAFTPAIYGFFYAWPMLNQQVRQVPVAVVDQDHSALSRTIIRYASAHPNLQVRVVKDEQEAQQALTEEEIYGYLLIPHDLLHDIVQQKKVHLPLHIDATYGLVNKAVSYGFMEVVGTVAAGVKIKKFIARGLSKGQANAARDPLTVTQKSYYNTTQGYGNYVLPAVSVIILQQTLLMAVAMVVAALYQQGIARTTVRGWFSRFVSFSLFTLLMGIFYFGWFFYFQGVARGGNFFGSVLLLILYTYCVALLGSLLGLLFKEPERCTYVMISVAMVFYFLSGVSWPEELLPMPLSIIRWLLPSTAAINASLRLNQMGATLYEVRSYYFILIGLIIFYGSLLYYVGVPHKKRLLNSG